MTIQTLHVPPAVLGEQELRRHIGRGLARALVDGDYARLLLSDPTTVLEERGCTPQQLWALRSIRATTLLEFARQARALFWSIEARDVVKWNRREDQHSLAAAAAV
jgi:hypothetical protein